MATNEENVPLTPVTNSTSETTAQNPEYRLMLEAKTGYRTYKAYLESLTSVSDRREANLVRGLLWEQLHTKDTEFGLWRAASNDHFVILDISRSKAVTDKIDVRLNLACVTKAVDRGQRTRHEFDAIALVLFQGLCLPLAENSSRTII